MGAVCDLEPDVPGLARACAECVVRNRAVCRVLSPDQLSELARMSVTREYRPGQVIIGDEETADFVATIQSGAVKLVKTLTDGRQQIVGLLFASDFLGKAYAERWNVTAEAATAVRLCGFPAKHFHEFLSRHPALEAALFAAMLDELDSARDWMVLLGRKSAREKVATFFTRLARRALDNECSAGSGTAVFELPMGRGDIADYLGLTIETVSRQITALKTSGMIRILPGRSVMVGDVERLARAADGDSS